MKYYHCLAATLVPTLLVATPILIGATRGGDLTVFVSGTMFVALSITCILTSLEMRRFLGSPISERSITHRTAVWGGCLFGLAHYFALCLVVGGLSVYLGLFK